VNNPAIRILKLTNFRANIKLSPAPTPVATPAPNTKLSIFREILQKSKKEVLEWGGHLYFVYLPGFTGLHKTKAWDDNNRYRETALRLAEELDIPVIDIQQEVFVPHADPMSLFPFRTGEHYNAEGYRLVAEAIHKRLKTDEIEEQNHREPSEETEADESLLNEQEYYNGIYHTKLHSFTFENIIEPGDLDFPWAMEFLPDGQMLVTERDGRLWLISKSGKMEKINNPPSVRNIGEGGLLDIVIDPEFEKNGFIYISYSNLLKGYSNLSNTSVMRATLKNNSLVNKTMIFRTASKFFGELTGHYGSRLLIDEDAFLFITFGDRKQRDQAQRLDTPNGKIHRIKLNGEIPSDNPFFNQDGAIKSVWTYGHRNPQGIAIHPVTKEIWSTEHGPAGGDELNTIHKGKNYGWPVITDDPYVSDISYLTHLKGMENPVIHWTPTIGISNITFYTGNPFKEWQNNLLVTSLKEENLYRLVIDEGKVVEEELVFSLGSRIRDIEIGPEGFIYLSLEYPGEIIQLRPINNSIN
jgi:glucose/arabinose dehydrogenase